MDFQQRKQELLDDPASPYWAADLIRLCDGKDIDDVLNTLEVMVDLFKLKYLDMLNEYSHGRH